MKLTRSQLDELQDAAKRVLKSIKLGHNRKAHIKSKPTKSGKHKGCKKCYGHS